MFTEQIMKLLKKFNRTDALILCNKIHEAEKNGYELTRQEDMLWEKLCFMIES